MRVWAGASPRSNCAWASGWTLPGRDMVSRSSIAVRMRSTGRAVDSVCGVAAGARSNSSVKSKDRNNNDR